MSKKRTHAETVPTPAHPLLKPVHTRRIVKRKLSAPEASSGSDSDSSASTSGPSISEASALFSTDGSYSTKRSSDTEQSEPSDGDSDAESSDLAESSEDTDTASESEDEDMFEENGESESENSSVITTVRVGKKPEMRRQQWAPGLDGEAEEGGLPLKERLKAFLPQIAAANVELEKEKAAGVLEERSLEQLSEGNNVDEPYIEMNLGLGVLEEKDPEAESSTSSEGEEDSNQDTTQNRMSTTHSNRGIMGRLLGRNEKKDVVGIQEVDS